MLFYNAPNPAPNPRRVRVFLAGDMCSMADIVPPTIIDFAGFIGIGLPDELVNLKRWHAVVSARPSAAA